MNWAQRNRTYQLGVRGRWFEPPRRYSSFAYTLSFAGGVEIAPVSIGRSHRVIFVELID